MEDLGKLIVAKDFKKLSKKSPNLVTLISMYLLSEIAENTHLLWMTTSYFSSFAYIKPENTHHRGKYHCIVRLTCLTGLDFTKQVKLSLIQQSKAA